MKLSIITINLNNREGLQRTIDSVVCQTFRDFEWIVIDGGSTDGSRELIEQYADHFAYWVSEPDKGIYNAMNKGIKVAKGEYLLFLNSGDCLYQQNVLQQVFTHSFSEDIVYCDDGGTDGVVKKGGSPDKITLEFLYTYTICHQTIFHKSSLFRDNLYDENYKIVADWKFLYEQLIKRDVSYRKLNILLCVLQAGESYDSSQTPNERFNVICNWYSEKERCFIEKHITPPPITSQQISFYLDNHSFIKKILKYFARIYYLHNHI